MLHAKKLSKLLNCNYIYNAYSNGRLNDYSLYVNLKIDDLTQLNLDYTVDSSGVDSALLMLLIKDKPSKNDIRKILCKLSEDNLKIAEYIIGISSLIDEDSLQTIKTLTSWGQSLKRAEK